MSASLASFAPRDAGGVDGHHTVVVAVAGLEQHAQPVAREHGADAVTPLDHGDRLTADQVVEPEVVELLQVVEPVDVDVHQRQWCVVLAHDGERRAHHRFGDAERDRDALRQHRLAGAELAVEHDDVARTQQRPEPLAERVGLARVACRRLQRHDGADARVRARA